MAVKMEEDTPQYRYLLDRARTVHDDFEYYKEHG